MKQIFFEKVRISSLLNLLNLLNLLIFFGPIQPDRRQKIPSKNCCKLLIDNHLNQEKIKHREIFTGFESLVVQIGKVESNILSKKTVASVLSVDKNPVDGLMNAI